MSLPWHPGAARCPWGHALMWDSTGWACLSLQCPDLWGQTIDGPDNLGPGVIA